MIGPKALAGDSLVVDGRVLRIIGLGGHDPAHTFVWIPGLRTVVGGVVVYENIHGWVASEIWN